MSVRAGLFSLTYEGTPAIFNCDIEAWLMLAVLITVTRITTALQKKTGVWT